MSQESPHLFPVYAQLPVRIVSGKGVVLHTDDGRESVAARLFFQTNAVPSTERAEAAAALADFAPDGLDRVFFVNSGAEANENALRLAFTARPGRDTVVSVTGGFHGRTAGAAAVTDGSAKWYGFPARPFSVRTVSRGDPEALAAAVDDRTAAVILEPVLGMAGAVPLADRFLRAAREACDRTGALLVFDEVQCGMGRSGRPFACEWAGVVPDLLTTAKALAGGFPAGALLASESLSGGLRVGALGTTFGGGPVACALVSTVIRVIREEDLLARVRRLSDRIRSEAVGGPVQAVQGRGFLLGLRCSRPAREVRNALLDRGIFVGVSSDPRVVRLMPPLVLEGSHVDRLVEEIHRIPA